MCKGVVGRLATVPGLSRRRPTRPHHRALASALCGSGVPTQLTGLRRVSRHRPHKARAALSGLSALHLRSVTGQQRPAPAAWPRWCRSIRAPSSGRHSARRARRPASGDAALTARDPRPRPGCGSVRSRFLFFVCGRLPALRNQPLTARCIYIYIYIGARFQAPHKGAVSQTQSSPEPPIAHAPWRMGRLTETARENDVHSSKRERETDQVGPQTRVDARPDLHMPVPERVGRHPRLEIHRDCASGGQVFPRPSSRTKAPRCVTRLPPACSAMLLLGCACHVELARAHELVMRVRPSSAARRTAAQRGGLVAQRSSAGHLVVVRLVFLLLVLGTRASGFALRRRCRRGLRC